MKRYRLCGLARMRVRLVITCLLATAMYSAAAAGPQRASQQTSASVLSEHHLEVLDQMSPQTQAEFLLERAINRYEGASEQIEARADGWRGKITLNERLNGLFMIALNSDEWRVRAAAIELDLAALNVPKTHGAIDGLEHEARYGDQGPRANALWRVGLLGNRGVQADRALDILMSAIHDENVNVRYWAVEGLAYLGTDDTIVPLLRIFHDDPSPTIRERAACGLAQSGMLTAKQRLSAVPQLLDFADDRSLDDQTRSWVFQALRDITGQTLPRDAAAWRSWHAGSRRK